MIDPLTKLPEILKRDLDSNLCVCNEVTKIKIINAIAEGGKSVDAVREKTYASDGNGCCRRDIERLIEVIWDTSSS